MRDSLNRLVWGTHGNPRGFCYSGRVTHDVVPNLPALVGRTPALALTQATEP